jgi:hypothetical protein
MPLGGGACQDAERENPCCQAMMRFPRRGRAVVRMSHHLNAAQQQRTGDPSRISHRAARSGRVTTRDKVGACTGSLDLPTMRDSKSRSNRLGAGTASYAAL